MAIRYRLILSYDGTGTIGWQKQRGQADSSGKPSIQRTLEDTISEMTAEAVSVVGSGRTDAGVHAVAQVAHFDLVKKEWDPSVLLKGLNTALPSFVKISNVQVAHEKFHAQRDAIKKQYLYLIQQGPSSFPHLDRYSWWLRNSLDVKSMGRALSRLEGEHDFKVFQAAGAVAGHTVRKIFSTSVEFTPSVNFPLGLGNSGCEDALFSNEFGMISIRLNGSGFLKQMVRSIVGSLIEVGDGRKPESHLLDLVLSGNRSQVGATAKSRGLWLERVWY